MSKYLLDPTLAMKVHQAQFQFDETILSDRNIQAESRAESVEWSPSDWEYSQKCYIVADLTQLFKRKSMEILGPTIFFLSQKCM